MAYVIQENTVGWQPIAVTSETQNHPLRTVVRAVDPTYGAGEFIYLQGVANTAIGHVVNYSASGATALATTALDEPDPLAVAMSANVASQYGWYQIGGLAVATKALASSFAAGARVLASSGVVVAAGSGNIIGGAVVAAAQAKSLGTTVTLMLSRPTGPSDLS